MSIFDKRNAKLKEKAKMSHSRRVEYMISDEVSFEVMEAFRNFKASITVSMAKKKTGEGTSIVMTSSCPEDGKTTVAVNLAMMFALSNVKVVLVDADIRKGRVAKFFKRRSAPGLADYLSGQKTLEEVTNVYKQNENLSYITCGTHSPRPYELLESEEMKELLEELKKKYDYVIIDTPPLLVVSDALALATQVDGTAVVCRHKVSYVNDLGHTLEKLKFAKANLLGVVVNDYNENVKASPYSDRYKYYSYCYDTSDTTKKD